MEWFTNPWVIGIIGSIPGGLLVNSVTGRILGRRENREYLQKVIGANRDVVYAIRPGISEGQIPSAAVLTSLVNATARRYNVEASDLYTPAQIAEELVKEVMDSSFISSVQKSEYCARLAELGGSTRKEAAETATEQPKAIVEYRQRLVSSVSMLLGLLTVTMTVMYSFLELLRTKKLNGGSAATDAKLDSLVPVFAAMATMGLTVAVFLLYRDVLHRKKSRTDMVLSDLRIGRFSVRAKKAKPLDS
jgi:hypothetical protein